MKKYLNITNFLILANILVFAFASTYKNSYLFLGLNIYFLKANLWYQPLSSMFMHSNILHLLMNMSVLYQFGESFKNYFGAKMYLGLYLIGGVMTSLLSFYFTLEFYVSRGIYHNMVGASGALCVILGFYAFFDKRQRNQIMTMIAIFSFFPLLIGISVAWYAHVIGFGIGFGVAFLVAYKNATKNR